MPNPRNLADEQSSNNLVVALMGQKIDYIQKDIAEIKATLVAAGYVSKEQMAEITKSADERMTRNEKRVGAIYTYGGTILGLLTVTLVGAFLKLILRI